MRLPVILSALLLLSACQEQRPPAPTAEEAEQLDAAEAMLDDQSNVARNAP
jgi:hypothetical protein